MSMPLHPDAYANLVDEDIRWLEAQPRTLERDHVIAICHDSVRLCRERVEARLAGAEAELVRLRAIVEELNSP